MIKHGKHIYFAKINYIVSRPTDFDEIYNAVKESNNFMVNFKHLNLETLNQDYYTENDFRIIEVPDY